MVKPVDEAKNFIQQQNVVNMDETGHKVAGQRSWVWLATTLLVSVFTTSFSRGTKVCQQILSESFAGYLISDRWSAYNWVATLKRQLCWAHLIRDFTKISQRAGVTGKIGNDLLEYVQKMFHLWHEFKDGKTSRQSLQLSMKPIQEKIESLLGRGVSCGNEKTQRTCKRLLKMKDALWTFLAVEGIEPTNNFAENINRTYVIWRKLSFGTQSDRGNLFVERVLTVVGTCKLQKRNAFDFVTECVEAHFAGKNHPSLLPENTLQNLALAA